MHQRFGHLDTDIHWQWTILHLTTFTLQKLPIINLDNRQAQDPFSKYPNLKP